MTSCFEWELKLLPHVIKWFEQAGRCVENKDTSLSSRKLDAIYQFTRAMPLTVVAKTDCWEKRQEMTKRKMFGVTWLRKGFEGHFEFIPSPIGGALVCLFLAVVIGGTLSVFSFKGDELIF